MIIKNDKMLVCFVNTKENPKKISRLGVFKYLYVGNHFYLFELCELTYPHPEAPDEGNVKLLDWIKVDFQKGTERLIKAAIDAVSDIRSITNLIGYSSEQT